MIDYWIVLEKLGILGVLFLVGFGFGLVAGFIRKLNSVA